VLGSDFAGFAGIGCAESARLLAEYGKAGRCDLTDQRQVLIGWRSYQDAIEGALLQHCRKSRIYRQAVAAQGIGRRLMGLCHCDDPDRGRLVEGSDVGSPHAPTTDQAYAKRLSHGPRSPRWA
jgi:hypothetical protein